MIPRATVTRILLAITFGASLAAGGSAIALSPSQNTAIFLPRHSAQTFLVQSVSLTAPKRNNFPGYVGMRFTTGPTGVAVSELGRLVIAGNSQSHRIELVDASTGSVLAATTLNTAGLPAGFGYAALPSPVTLAANHSYYLVSQETSGGDYWYDNSETVTPSTLVKSIDSSVYSLDNSTWSTEANSNNAYVPTDLIGTPTTSNAMVTGPTEDEFVGPFASWTNVKTAYGATGNGSTDDTTAIQNALNALVSAGGGALYFPAGTYIISSTLTAINLQMVQLIGQDPTTTTIKWAGASGGVMFQINGYKYSNEGRLTWDGSGTAGTGELVASIAPNSGTSVTHFDEVFQNMGIGLQVGTGSNADDTHTVIRCHFINNTTAGVETDSWNTLEVMVWYSTFQNNAIGIYSLIGQFQSLYNTFFNSSVADMQDAQGQFMGIRGNYSLGSNQFFHQVPVGQNATEVSLQNNTVLDTINPVAIEMLNPGMLRLTDNKIRSKPGNTGPAVSLAPSGGVGGDLESIGNTFSVASPESCVGTSLQCWTLDDQASVGTITGAPLSLPTPPNLNRHIIEVPAGSNAATIQNAINSAVAYQGSRPVVHLPTGLYFIASTIVIPANLDVQVIGDGFSTQFSWSGPASGLYFQLHSPSKCLIQDMFINGQNEADGILIGSEDVVGSRIQLRDVNITNTVTGVFAEGLTNTSVNLYSSNSVSGLPFHVIGTGVSAPSYVACFSCPNIGGDLVSDTGPEVSLTQNGNMLIEDSWSEPPQETVATLTGAAGNLTIDTFLYVPKNNSSPASVTLDNYSGNFVWSSSELGQAAPHTIGPMVVTNPTANTNALILGNFFYHITPQLFNIAPGGNFYARDNVYYVDGTGTMPTPDVGGTPSDAFMRSTLTQFRTLRPSLNTPLPAGTSDVQLTRLWFQNTLTGFHVKPGP